MVALNILLLPFNCCFRGNYTIKRIDGISSLLSFVGLCFALYYYREETRFQTWNDKFVWLNQTSEMIEQSTDYQEEFMKTCNDSTNMEYKMYIGSTTWIREDKTKITYNSISMPIEGEGFNPWYMLMFVLYISSVFQGTRCIFNGLNFGGLTYDPGSGPDFSRWLEYAITSPLQILIVASIFSLGNSNLLLTLACLQGALVILGFLLELIMDDIMINSNDESNKSDKSDKKESKVVNPQRNFIELLFVLFTSIFFHIVIWYIIINTFLSQLNTAKDCSDVDIEIPPIVTFIIGIQCFFFSTFGLVLCFQAFYVIFCANFCNYVSLYKQRRKIWYTVTVCYSILSVLAKGSLEYGFIFFITMYDVNNE